MGETKNRVGLFLKPARPIQQHAENSQETFGAGKRRCQPAA
jgi:hypothetical protein